MTLTVNQLYKIANKMMKDSDVIKEKNEVFINSSLESAVIFLLNNADGFNELFKEVNMGDELHLYEKNGRIYYYLVNQWDMYTGKFSPITDNVLKRFPLTKNGELFIKKYL